MLGVYQTFCPPYNPQSNRVERAHLTLFRLVRIDRSFNEGTWVPKLPMATFFFNTVVNKTTGYSPFETVFGRAPTLPIDLLWPLCPQRNDGTFLEEVEKLRIEWQEMLEDISQRQDDYHLALKNNCNKYTGQLKIGDMVYYFRNCIPGNLSKKLQGLYIGPFKVVKIVSDSVVVIHPEGKWASKPRNVSVNVSRVRKIDPDLDLSKVKPDKQELTPVDFEDEFEDDILLTPADSHRCLRNCKCPAAQERKRKATEQSASDHG